MTDSLPLFFTYFTILIITDIAIHVMIQMYFEGHEAFNEPFL